MPIMPPYRDYYQEDHMRYLFEQLRYELARDMQRLTRELMYEQQRYNYSYTYNQPIYYPMAAIEPTKENKVPTEPKKYIVANTNITDNTLDESFEIISFDTSAEAEKHAKEQARENKGESYTVFQTYKTFRVTEPVEEVVHV